jgi:phage-related protein
MEAIKSAVRHILVLLLTVVGFIGLGKWQPILEFIRDNLDSISDAIKIIVGFVGAIIAFVGPKLKDGQLTTRFN